MGSRVAIDDVGAGNAGLRLLSELRFNVVKVDLTLVQAAVQDETSRGVLRSISELARNSGATAIAEGVETPSQLRAVREMGLPTAQGYLLGRPAPTPVLRSIDLEAISRGSDLRAALDGGVPAWDLGLPN